MRKVIAIVAALGCIAGIYTFIASFFGLTMDKLGAKAVLLHLGIFALFIPLAFAERWGKRVNPFLGRPRWVNRSEQIRFLLSGVVFVTFLALSHAATTEIINGDYVFEQSWKNNPIHLRTRLSLHESLGIAVLRLTLDFDVLRADDAQVVSPARRVDCGDAGLTWTGVRLGPVSEINSAARE